MDALLLVNLGTPDSPKREDVKRYLTQFLTDERVIDLPYIRRQLLVRGAIIPRRCKSSSRAYEAIWQERGSPLLYYGEKLKEEMANTLPHVRIALGMRYGSPSIEEALNSIRGADRLIVLPLFPQYASATTGSVHQEVMRILSSWQTIPELHLVNSYPEMEEMIEAIADRAKSFDLSSYDEILFSFHGLPERQLFKRGCKVDGCCERGEHPSCYGSQCFATARAIEKRLRIKGKVTFQSRLGKEPWLRPYTQETVERLAKEGKKRVLIFSPAFVADCLETIYELGHEVKEEFLKLGGERLDYVPSLNDHPVWIRGLSRIALEALPKRAHRCYC